MKNYLKVFGSIALGILFLWLAFKDIALSDILEATKGMSYSWILPFVLATLAAHLVRAIRWKMLFTNKEKTPSLFTLYTGVMFGYLTNIILPRVGEVTRPVYVAKQVDESSSKLIGTIVLERIIDLLSMLLLMIFVGIFLVSDPEVLSRLFGIDFTDTDTQLNLILTIITYAVIAILGAGIAYWILKEASKKSERVNGIFMKGKSLGKTFLDGILAIRELKNWPLFIFHTGLIWFLYIFMTYVGFWMFDMHEIYSLGMTEALVLTMVSAVGLSIPTPGGLGTYHLFITKSLFILYGVPEATGLAYATIAHASTIVIVMLTSPLLLAIDKFVVLKRGV
ncbi:MAG: lysylphosphatidylglycerol synthase transmembrane domain-containing protein [Balneolaceae bacterium]